MKVVAEWGLAIDSIELVQLNASEFDKIIERPEMAQMVGLPCLFREGSNPPKGMA